MATHISLFPADIFHYIAHVLHSKGHVMGISTAGIFMNALLQTVDKFRKYFRLLEDAVLVSLLGGMILMAGLQITLRNTGSGGFVWNDELLRGFVLWLGLFGAMSASREMKHVHIDVLTRFLSDAANRWFKLFSCLFTSSLCGVIAYNAALFVLEERDAGTTMIGSTPSWLFLIILPIGFGVISLRYLRHFFAAGMEILGRGKS